MSKRLCIWVLAGMIILLNSCNQQPQAPFDTRPVLGEFDSLSIAADTVMQKGIESSYEYSTSLAVTHDLVFDVRAYGGPASHGEYAIIRRDANNKSDTIIRAKRWGSIANAFTADLNKNNLPEVYLVFRTIDSFTRETLVACEIDKSGKIEPIAFNIQLLKQYVREYKGNDSIYHLTGESRISHDFPLIDSGKLVGTAKIKYALEGIKLEAKKFDIIDNTGKTKSIIP